jgi:hypothetical protein
LELKKQSRRIKNMTKKLKLKKRPLRRRPKNEFGMKEAVGLGVGLVVLGAGLNALKGSH